MKINIFLEVKVNCLSSMQRMQAMNESLIDDSVVLEKIVDLIFNGFNEFLLKLWSLFRADLGIQRVSGSTFN